MTIPDDAVRVATGYTSLAVLANRVGVATIHASKGRLTEKDKVVLRRARRLLRAADAPEQFDRLVTAGTRAMADARDADVLVRAVGSDEDRIDLSPLSASVDAVLTGRASDEDYARVRSEFGRLGATSGNLAQELVRPAAPALAWPTLTTS